MHVEASWQEDWEHPSVTLMPTAWHIPCGRCSTSFNRFFLTQLYPGIPLLCVDSDNDETVVPTTPTSCLDGCILSCFTCTQYCALSGGFCMSFLVHPSLAA